MWGEKVGTQIIEKSAKEVTESSVWDTESVSSLQLVGHSLFNVGKWRWTQHVLRT